MTAKLNGIEPITLFIFGGNATFTLRSTQTGRRFTYRTRESDDDHKHWVSVLTGSDNDRDYAYLGFFDGPEYQHGRKSKISREAPSAAAFAWFAKHLAKGRVHPKLEVWHEGRCGACGRKLTVPESIETGFGPECAGRLGLTVKDSAKKASAKIKLSLEDLLA